MRIAVVGATGPTGRLVVERLLARGHDVIAYVRRPEALTPLPHLTIVGGQLDNRSEFLNAIRGSDVLVCTLGNRSWRERSFMTKHLPLVTDAMEDAGVDRLVLMSALGGGELPPRVHGISRIVFKFLSNVVFKDRTVSEAELTRRNVNWCAVYPGFLNDAVGAPKADVVDLNELTEFRNGSVSRANVADVLVELAEDAQSGGRRLAVGPAGSMRH